MSSRWPRVRDRGAHAAAPGVAVAEADHRRLDALQPVDRRERLRARGRERGRHHLHALAAGQRVARAQHVADQQRRVALEVQRDAPLGVTGRVQHARTAGHVEAFIVAERRDLADAHAARLARRGRARPSAATRRGSAGTGRIEPSRLPPACVSASCSSAACTSTGTPCSVRSRSAKPTWSGCAWVSTSARMSPQTRPDLAQAGPELVVERGDAGVDHRQPGDVLDQIEVDEIAAQPMQPLGDARHFCLNYLRAAMRGMPRAVCACRALPAAGLPMAIAGQPRKLNVRA